MARLLATCLFVVLVVGRSTATRAQSGADDGGSWPAAADGVVPWISEPYGGFGLEYSQPARAGSMIVDQYGMWHVLPYAAAEPLGQAVPPTATFARSRLRRAGAMPRYSLPTGSLYWPGANEIILYSPELRYRSYGGGIGRGPYGSYDHSLMYQGRLLRD